MPAFFAAIRSICVSPIINAFRLSFPSFARAKFTGSALGFGFSTSSRPTTTFIKFKTPKFSSKISENFDVFVATTPTSAILDAKPKASFANGKLEAEGEFEWGRLVRTKKYDEAGKLISDKSDKNGLPRE